MIEPKNETRSEQFELTGYPLISSKVKKIWGFSIQKTFFLYKEKANGVIATPLIFSKMAERGRQLTRIALILALAFLNGNLSKGDR